MNIGLFSGPASKVSADLLVFLVDEKEMIHSVDDPEIVVLVFRFLGPPQPERS